MSQAVFDSMAVDYDAVFTNSSIGKLQRKIVWNYLENSGLLKPRIRVLELNCGTGEDALNFARKGCYVLASDISEQMLNVAQTKAIRQGFKEEIAFETIDLTSFNSAQFVEQFDVVFSNFGGLNCIDSGSMKKFGNQVQNVLKPKGRFVSVVMPEKCAMESLYFMLKGDFKSAFRRNDAVEWTNEDGQKTTIHYYSPKAFYQSFSNWFTKIDLVPVGLIIPPSYTEQFFKNRKRTLALLEQVDERLRFSQLAPLADHYLIDLQRIGS